MHNVMFQQMPHYVQKEMELIEGSVKALARKNAIYTFVSVPMMVFAIMNLLVLVITGGITRETISSILIFALLAATGIALQQETRFLRKQMQLESNEQIIRRIQHSDYLTDSRKKEYISLIKTEPLLGFQTFIDFLTEEQRRKNLAEQIS